MTRMDSDLPTQNTEDRPHKPADDKEVVYFEGSPLLRGEIGKTILFGLIGLILIAAPFIYSATQDEWLPWWATGGLIIIGLALMFIPVLIIRSIRYRVSNYRIDYERGIFSRNIDTLELWHVDDISFHQSFLDRILNVGTITITSDDKSTPNLPLHGVPNPRPLFDSLKQRVIAVKRQRGVIKMDMGQ
jgi:membrane protein YdbS with pleckstrin-like domain